MLIARILPHPPHPSDAPLSLRMGWEQTASGSPQASPFSHASSTCVDATSPGPWL